MLFLPISIVLRREKSLGADRGTWLNPVYPENNALKPKPAHKIEELAAEAYAILTALDKYVRTFAHHVRVMYSESQKGFFCWDWV